MKHSSLTEDKLPPKLLVGFSSAIAKQIDRIYSCNQNNGEAIYQWLDYLDWVLDYMSNPVIAWDNINKHRQWPNETRFVSDFDINVGYKIIADRRTNKPFVYLFRVNLKLEEFGLTPPPLEENKSRLHLSESQLRRVIQRTLINVLYS